MLNRNTVNRVRELSEEVANAEYRASELKKTAQDRHGEREHNVKYPNGEIKRKEKDLWEEIFQLGALSPAYTLMQDTHPDVFAAYEVQGKKADEIKAYINREVGVDMTRMRITDYLQLTEDMFNMLYDEREADKNK